MSAVIVTAVFHPKDGKKQEIADAMRRGIEAVHTESGCELYSIHDAEDGTVTMIEKWSSAEELDAHGEGEPGEDSAGRYRRPGGGRSHGDSDAPAAPRRPGAGLPLKRQAQTEPAPGLAVKRVRGPACVGSDRTHELRVQRRRWFAELRKPRRLRGG